MLATYDGSCKLCLKRANSASAGYPTSSAPSVHDIQATITWMIQNSSGTLTAFVGVEDEPEWHHLPAPVQAGGAPRRCAVKLL
jgi:hypothetical protein